MDIQLRHKGIYSDTVKRIHLTQAIDYTQVAKRETNRGVITETTKVKGYYLEVIKGTAHIELTENNCMVVKDLVATGMLEYMDNAHKKLVESMAPEDAEIVTPEPEPEPEPVKELEPVKEPEAKLVDDETNFTIEDLMDLSMPQLRKLAKAQSVSYEKDAKKREIADLIIAKKLEE